MTQPCYGTEYPEDFKRAVKNLAHKDKSLLAILNEGPASIGRLEYELRVSDSDRLEALFLHAASLKSTNPDSVLKGASDLTADLAYLEQRQAVHNACVEILPPRYKPVR